LATAAVVTINEATTNAVAARSTTLRPFLRRMTRPPLSRATSDIHPRSVNPGPPVTLRNGTGGCPRDRDRDRDRDAARTRSAAVPPYLRGNFGDCSARDRVRRRAS